MKNTLIVVVVIVLALAGYFAWQMYGEEKAVKPVASEAALEAELQPLAEPELVVEPPFVPADRQPLPELELETLPLPPLAESDAHAREALASVLGEEAVGEQFVQEGLVARAVATIDALASRQVPGNIQFLNAPEDSYIAIEDNDPPTVMRNEEGDVLPQYLSDPANAARYEPYVAMLESVSSERFVAMYRGNYGLFQEAWRELGYADSDFNDRLVEVIDELLATPEAREPYRLVKPEAYYQFVDEDLESLSAGQKILLRMGSENAARVKSKLAEIRQAL